MKIQYFLLLLSSMLLYGSNASADKAIFAGGCFWCMESDFEKLEGVTDVISGFTGGTMKNPTYNGNHAGHYEAVEVSYDPEKVGYKELLDYYWLHIDPFDARGQFCDKGSSYLSAIFVANDKERNLAEQSKKRVADQFPTKKVVTPIIQQSTFYPLIGNESNHQDYYKKNPVRYKVYRWNCGRDRRLQEVWGDKAVH
jgi:peptide-methionine (S)-S-oxide reductase